MFYAFSKKGTLFKRNHFLRKYSNQLNKRNNVFPFYFQSNWSARMDFLATYAAVNLDGALISKEITGIMGCQVGLSKDLYGSDLPAKSTLGTSTLCY